MGTCRGSSCSGRKHTSKTMRYHRPSYVLLAISRQNAEIYADCTNGYTDLACAPQLKVCIAILLTVTITLYDVTPCMQGRHLVYHTDSAFLISSVILAYY